MVKVKIDLPKNLAGAGMMGTPTSEISLSLSQDSQVFLSRLYQWWCFVSSGDSLGGRESGMIVLLQNQSWLPASELFALKLPFPSS